MNSCNGRLRCQVCRVGGRDDALELSVDARSGPVRSLDGPDGSPVALGLVPFAVYPVTLCYFEGWPAVARVVARNQEHAVHREHSGAQVPRSVQVASPERYAGLLVMRRSGVRFPKAAPPRKRSS